MYGIIGKSFHWEAGMVSVTLRTFARENIDSPKRENLREYTLGTFISGFIQFPNVKRSH